MYETSPELRLWVVTDGGHPTGPQVERLFSRGAFDPKTAVLSAHPTTRFVISAMTFFNRRIRVFAPTEIGRAAEYLEIDALNADRIVRCVTDLRGELTY